MLPIGISSEYIERRYLWQDLNLLKADLQLLKKLSQCLAILKRLTYGKSNKLHNNLKIIYVILGHLGAQTNPRSCDLV
jgi:hypothetical protein